MARLTPSHNKNSSEDSSHPLPQVEEEDEELQNTVAGRRR